MENEILTEIKQLKTAISFLIGTAELPQEEQFSKKALDKVEKDFKKLSIERGDWIEEYYIKKFIKNAPYKAGAFIRQEFKFKNYFKRGQTYYYNKKDLIALSKELRARKVDMGRYMEFKADQEKFNKYLQGAKENRSGKRIKYKIPQDARDISTTPAKAPPENTIKEDLNRLIEEFNQFNLADYIDIYKGNHAMMKSIYFYEKYIDAELKKRCKRWCDNFNYAHHALELVNNEH